jgi:hypothetical protein
MRGLREIIAGTLTIAALAGCDRQIVRQTFSEEMREPAKVIQPVYTPERHGSGSSSGTTFDMDGNIGVHFSDVDVHTKAVYGVVFECQHGNFVSQGTDERHEDLWKRMRQGSNVTITYREVYSDTIQVTDGKETLLGRGLVDYDFIDAIPANTTEQ